MKLGSFYKMNINFIMKLQYYTVLRFYSIFRYMSVVKVRCRIFILHIQHIFLWFDVYHFLYKSSVVVFFFIEYFWIVPIKFVIVVYHVFRYYRMFASFLINVSSISSDILVLSFIFVCLTYVASQSLQDNL